MTAVESFRFGEINDRQCRSLTKDDSGGIDFGYDKNTMVTAVCAPAFRPPSKKTSKSKLRISGHLRGMHWSPWFPLARKPINLDSDDMSWRYDGISRRGLLHKDIWVRPRNCGCLVTWFCSQLIAKPSNNTATVSWPDPYVAGKLSFYVRGPCYFGLTRSISWLLMPWLLTSPGHLQPWYLLCRIGRFLSYLMKDLN